MFYKVTTSKKIFFMNIRNIAKKIRNGFIRASLTGKPLESIFTHIYANNAWGDRESVSGHGSSLKKTAEIRREIPTLLKRHAIRSIFDAPCGDFNWMRTVDLSGIEYIGADIVAALVKANQNAYSSINKEFIKLDVATAIPPKVDLILCRDLLIHLPLAECQKVLSGFISSGSTYLLTTSYVHQPQNTDIEPGAWRPINLQLAPFGLPAPISSIADGDANPELQDYGKALCLWRLCDLNGNPPSAITRSV
jgi:hypothetical protein